MFVDTSLNLVFWILQRNKPKNPSHYCYYYYAKRRNCQQVHLLTVTGNSFGTCQTKQHNLIAILFIYFWMDNRLYSSCVCSPPSTLGTFTTIRAGNGNTHQHSLSVYFHVPVTSKYTKIVILSLKLWGETASENNHQWFVQSNHCFNLMFYGMTYQFCWCKLWSLNTALSFFFFCFFLVDQTTWLNTCIT